jgi:hypothetical protein
MAHRTASLSGEPQGGECLPAEGKRSAKAPRPALSLNPLSSALWLPLLLFLAVACAPIPWQVFPAFVGFWSLLFGFVEGMCIFALPFLNDCPT